MVKNREARGGNGNHAGEEEGEFGLIQSEPPAYKTAARTFLTLLSRSSPQNEGKERHTSWGGTSMLLKRLVTE